MKNSFAYGIITIVLCASCSSDNKQSQDAPETPLGDIGVDPNTSTLGLWLECDTENECIKPNAKANKLVKGSYRKPFEVPEVQI